MTSRGTGNFPAPTLDPLRMNHHRPSNRAAFTLVEMLLVVTVLAMLISILLPSLTKARDASRTVVCTATMHQLNDAFSAYLRDNQGRSFIYIGNVGQVSFDNFWMALLEKYSGKVDEFRVCPQASKKSETVWGSADLAWSGHTHPDGYWIRCGGDFHWGSYGLNGWLYNGYNSNSLRLRIPTLQHSLTPVFADSAWVDGWPATADAAPADLKSPFSPTGPTPSQMGRFCVDRHTRAVNVATLDGAVKLTPLASLWKFMWSPTFVPGGFNPGL